LHNEEGELTGLVPVLSSLQYYYLFLLHYTILALGVVIGRDEGYASGRHGLV